MHVWKNWLFSDQSYCFAVEEMKVHIIVIKNYTKDLKKILVVRTFVLSISILDIHYLNQWLHTPYKYFKSYIIESYLVARKCMYNFNHLLTAYDSKIHDDTKSIRCLRRYLMTVTPWTFLFNVVTFYLMAVNVNIFLSWLLILNYWDVHPPGMFPEAEISWVKFLLLSICV